MDRRHPEPLCVIDRTRACGACIAPSPRECPYAYLLDAEERAEVVRAAARRRDGQNAAVTRGGLDRVAGAP
jgi:hypothetical protein